MFLYILTLLISVPLIELMVILKVNEFIGFRWTIVIIILTGITGSFLLRHQGRTLVAVIRSKIEDGEMPADKIIEGFFLFSGGIMLLFPGYVTDVIGLFLMIPGNRRLLRKFAKKRIRTNVRIRAHTDDRDPDEI